MARKVFRAGNSLVVSLPQDLLELLDLEEGSEVVVELDRERGSLIITPLGFGLEDVDVDFSRRIDAFMSQYGPALGATGQVNYLTTRQLHFLHARLIDETGGTLGLRDLTLLESAVDEPRATAEGRDLYRDLFSKAAALMQSLMLNSPFLEGNERTAIASAALFLLQNHRQLVASTSELERMTREVARGEMDIPEIAAWLRQNSQLLA